jgi:hypothetical protein
MTWLFPAGIVSAVALAVIVLLHMRHRLPEVIPFPQLAFWPRVPSETRESPRWRKPPLSLLFLLQLLAALLLVLAFMRPAIPGLGAFGGERTSAIHHLVVLDGSTSMLAAGSDGGSRWDDAIAAVDDVLNDWQQGDGVTLILASARPQVRSAADERQLGQLRDWVHNLAVPGGVPDQQAIADLIAGATLPDLDRQVTLVTDGGLAIDGVNARRVTVGEPVANNVAIVETSTSPLDNGGQLIEATVLHDRSNTETLPWVARSSDQDLASGTLTLGPQAEGTFTVKVPAGVERVTLELVADDAMAADNRAVVSTGGDALTGIRIVLVSDVPSPTQRALEVLPGASVEVYPSTTPGIADIAASADLVVYEATAPAEGDVPTVPMLLVQPTGLADAWQITGVSPEPGVSDVALDDPVMRDISLEGVQFGETPTYVLDPSATVLASGTQDGTSVPLVWRGTLEGQPYVAYAFDPAGSNISNRVTFPVLVAQTVASLAGTKGSSVVSPGDVISLTLPKDAARVRVEDPSSRTTTVRAHIDASGTGSAAFPVSARPGVWTISVEDSGGSELEHGSVVVNVGDAHESLLSSDAPITLTLANTGGSGAVAASGTGNLLTEAWPLLVIAAALVIGLEWWLWLVRSLSNSRVAREQTS